MAYIMGLEGPKVRPALAATPLPVMTTATTYTIAPSMQTSFWYKFGLSPSIWASFFGLVGGAYLAGSSRGQRLVARFRRR